MNLIIFICFSVLFCFSFIQKVTYKTKRPVFDLRTIAEVEGAGVKAGKHAEWREQIIVPPLPQSALAGCSLIDIEYFIQVRVLQSSHSLLLSQGLKLSIVVAVATVLQTSQPGGWTAAYGLVHSQASLDIMKHLFTAFRATMVRKMAEWFPAKNILAQDFAQICFRSVSLEPKTPRNSLSGIS